MLAVGSIVRVLPPFDETYAETYPIVAVIFEGDTPVAYELEGIGAFDPRYLEEVAP